MLLKKIRAKIARYSKDPADYATLFADFLHYYSQMKLSQTLFSVTAPCSWA